VHPGCTNDLKNKSEMEIDKMKIYFCPDCFKAHKTSSESKQNSFALEIDASACRVFGHKK